MPLYSFLFVCRDSSRFTIRAKSFAEAQIAADQLAPRGCPVLYGFSDTL
jgi:hypothetical protein